MREKLFLLGVIIFPVVGFGWGGQPPYQPAYTNLPNTGFNGNDYSCPTYRDILSHAEDKEFAVSGIGGTLPFNAHENIHFLNALLGKVSSQKNVKGIYVFQGRGIVIEQPQTRALDIRENVSDQVKNLGYIYQNYFKHYLFEPAADTSFLLILDEWSATVAQARVAFEGFAAKTLVANHIRCETRHSEEWTYLASAGLQYLVEHEKSYLETAAGEQFKAAFVALAEDTLRVRVKTQGIEVFNNQCRPLDHIKHLQTAPENKRIRDAIVQIFGRAWAHDILGIGAT